MPRSNIGFKSDGLFIEFAKEIWFKHYILDLRGDLSAPEATWEGIYDFTSINKKPWSSDDKNITVYKN